jgi:hypothetical protein
VDEDLRTKSVALGYWNVSGHFGAKFWSVFGEVEQDGHFLGDGGALVVKREGFLIFKHRFYVWDGTILTVVSPTIVFSNVTRYGAREMVICDIRHLRIGLHHSIRRRRRFALLNIVHQLFVNIFATIQRMYTYKVPSTSPISP